MSDLISLFSSVMNLWIVVSGGQTGGYVVEDQGLSLVSILKTKFSRV